MKASFHLLKIQIVFSIAVKISPHKNPSEDCKVIKIVQKKEKKMTLKNNIYMFDKCK